MKPGDLFDHVRPELQLLAMELAALFNPGASFDQLWASGALHAALETLLLGAFDV